MPIKLSKPLETKRLFIRQFIQEDFTYIVRNLNDHALKNDFQLISDNINNDKFYFLLILRESDQNLGFIVLQTLEKEEQIECYYELLSQYTGSGYAIEALKKIFDYIFTNHKFTKIVAYVDQGNVRGWKVAERSGMKYMGEFVRNGANAKSMHFLINKRDFFNQFQF